MSSFPDEMKLACNLKLLREQIVISLDYKKNIYFKYSPAKTRSSQCCFAGKQMAVVRCVSTLKQEIVDDTLCNG